MGKVAYEAGLRAMELLGHESVETTQIYTHVMAKPGLGEKSFGFLKHRDFVIITCRRAPHPSIRKTNLCS